MRVSSRHLSLASSVFCRMLKGPWKESEADIDGIYEIKTSEWDAYALVIVLDIIHGHHKAVPQTINLEMMGKVTTIIDYYDCREVTDVFTTSWIKLLASALPETYGKESTVWLYLAHAYTKHDVLQKMAQLTCLGARRQPYTLGFVVPQRILGESNILDLRYRHQTDQF